MLPNKKLISGPILSRCTVFDCNKCKFHKAKKIGIICMRKKVTRSHAFSRVLRQLHVITWSFDWFTVLSEFLVIG